jgi:K+-transporting ATPase ATPase C chain
VKLIKAFNDDKAPLVFIPKTPIPADAVTASASGLDPHISPGNAQTQAARVARARGVPMEQVQGLIAQHTDGRTLGFLGDPSVNVLELNLALDQQSARK